MQSHDRRLPVYLLIDCSESMVGEAIEGANAGMRQLLLDLHSDPHALETVWISVITFAQTATQVLPLTEMIGTRAPKLKIQPGTGLGAALRLLQECIAREVRTHSATEKGDWKPSFSCSPTAIRLTNGARRPKSSKNRPKAAAKNSISSPSGAARTPIRWF